MPTRTLCAPLSALYYTHLHCIRQWKEPCEPTNVTVVTLVPQTLQSSKLTLQCDRHCGALNRRTQLLAAASNESRVAYFTVAGVWRCARYGVVFVHLLTSGRRVDRRDHIGELQSWTNLSPANIGQERSSVRHTFWFRWYVSYPQTTDRLITAFVYTESSLSCALLLRTASIRIGRCFAVSVAPELRRSTSSKTWRVAELDTELV